MAKGERKSSVNAEDLFYSLRFLKRLGDKPVCFFVYWQKKLGFGNSMIRATSRIGKVELRR